MILVAPSQHQRIFCNICSPSDSGDLILHLWILPLESHESKDFYNWRRDIDKKIIDPRFRSRLTYSRIETRYLRYLVSTRLDPTTSAGSSLATVISTGRISGDPFEATLRRDRERDVEGEPGGGNNFYDRDSNNTGCS